MDLVSFEVSPFLILGVLFLLSVVIYFWNRKNTDTNRKLKHRNFRQEYYQKKKKQEKPED